jgi:hypothetical protein
MRSDAARAWRDALLWLDIANTRHVSRYPTHAGAGGPGGPMTEEDKKNVRDAVNPYLKPYLRG